MHLTIIQPKTGKEGKKAINCVACKLMDYTHEDYSLFKGLGKLVYFFLHNGKDKKGPLCHYCIEKEVILSTPTIVKEIDVEVIDGEQRTTRRFYEGTHRSN